MLQGGIDSAMLDFAVLADRPDGDDCTTASLTVSFLRAAHPCTFRAAGAVEGRGRSLAFARAALHGRDDELVATASSTLAVRRSI